MQETERPLLGDRYRLVSPIATGGMGTVWEGWDERLQRRVAIKQLHPQPGLDPQTARVAAERMLREARNAARLHHPHAVPVYDVVDDDGRPCLVMQYLPAPSLQQLLTTRGPLDVASVARIGSELASALEAAHRVGIVHRDVKPGNVLVGADGAAKLTDFGISHAFGDPSLTSTGIVTGTPAYLAPEVAQGVPASPASDVFSLGSTLYTALEGTSPFGDGQNPMATLYRAASGQLDPPRRSGPLTPVLHRMLAVDPAQRPPMAEVAAALRQVARPGANAAFAPTAHLAAARPATPPPSSTVVLPPAVPAGGGPGGRPPGGRPGDPAARGGHRGRTALLIAAALLAALVAGGLVALLTHDSGGPASAGGPATAAHRPATSRPAARTPSASPRSRSRTPTRAASTPPPRRASRTSAAQQGPADPATAVVQYYALLPGNTDAAWNLLTRRFQQGRAGGRGTFDQYWGSMRSVRATDAQDLGPDRAAATIHYVYRDGRRAAERTVFTFKKQGGVLKIDRTQTGG